MRPRTISFFLVTALATTAALAVACRDTATAPRGSAPGADRAPSRSTQPQLPAGVDIRAELRKANPMDWVGAAHNAALDAFLEELNKPGVLTRDICGHILDFSARDERVPSDRRAVANGLAASARRDVARKALARSPLCAPATQSASTTGEFLRLAQLASMEAPGLTTLARAMGFRAGPARQSSAAYNLLSQVESAIQWAYDSYDLAARLNPILNAAASLAYEEYATVAATVSVAQSSYEYWPTGYTTYYDGIRRDYGACADQTKSWGYSAYDARNYCMGSSSTTKNYTEFGRAGGRIGGERVALMFVRPASASVRQYQCPTVGEGLRKIGRRDAIGAFGGAFSGAFVGGWEGAALGGIVGGSGGSIATAIELVWDHMWHCNPNGGSGTTKTYR